MTILDKHPIDKVVRVAEGIIESLPAPYRKKRCACGNQLVLPRYDMCMTCYAKAKTWHTS